MGLDVLPYLGGGCYRAYYHPTLYIVYNDYPEQRIPAWSDGYSIYLNSYYLNTVTESDWLSDLNPAA